MESNNRKALKSGVWYTASNFFVRSIGFLTTPIFTRLLTHAEYGAYNNYSSWLAIITIFVTLNLESTLISARFDYKDNFDEYIFSILSLSSLSAIIWFALFNIFTSESEHFLGLNRLYINAMLLYLLFLPAINLFQSRERYQYEYKKTVIISVLLAVSTAFLSVLLVVNLNDKLFGRIIGSVLPTIIIGAALYIFFIKKGKKIKIECWKYALPICLPYIPHLLSMTLLNSTDRIMIKHWCGDEATALYSLAYNCGALVTMFLTALNSAYSPWLGDKLNQKKYSEIRQFSKKYISGFMFLAIGVMIIAPEILLILGGKSYLEAIYVMAPVSTGCICQFLYTLFVSVEQFKKKTVGMAVASMLAAALNFLLNCIFIPKFGYLAAAYTTLAGYACLLCIHMFLVYKMNMQDVYSYHFVLLAFFVAFALMLLIMFSYSIKTLHYISIVLYCVVAFVLAMKKKDDLIAFFKR